MKPTAAFRKYFADTPKNFICFKKYIYIYILVTPHVETKLREIYEITVGWTPSSERETKNVGRILVGKLLQNGRQYKNRKMYLSRRY
jgi:hypothetical protein